MDNLSLIQWRRYAEAAIASLPQFSIGEATADTVCKFADQMMAEEAKRTGAAS